MRVFSYENTIINCDDDCPSVNRLLNDGAEEIAVALFGEYPQYANTDNTFKNDEGEWIFEFDAARHVKQKQLHCMTAYRKRRDELLASSDWTQIPDAPIKEEAKSVWATYRQALRDVPQQEGFPEVVEWPEIPV